MAEPVITAALVTGGINLVMGILGGWGEAELAEMDNDTKLKIAADQLGLNYEQLKQSQSQFTQSLSARAREFGATLGLQKSQLALQREEMKRKYGLSEKQFGLQEKQVKADIGFKAAEAMRASTKERERQKSRKIVSAQLAGKPAAPKPPPTAPPMGAPPPTTTRTGKVSGPLTVGGLV